MPEKQPELGLFEPPSPEQKADALAMIELLRGHDWLNAEKILLLLGRETTDANKRWLRLLANQSEGQIASGQKGYKLVQEMTAEEYNHFRNWMKAQADNMTARILRSDKIFYGRQPVTSGNGILAVPDTEKNGGRE